MYALLTLSAVKNKTIKILLTDGDVTDGDVTGLEKNQYQDKLIVTRKQKQTNLILNVYKVFIRCKRAAGLS